MAFGNGAGDNPDEKTTSGDIILLGGMLLTGVIIDFVDEIKNRLLRFMNSLKIKLDSEKREKRAKIIKNIKDFLHYGGTFTHKDSLEEWINN